MNLSPEIDRKIRKSFASQSFMASISARISELGAGHCCLTCPIDDGYKQQHGVAHAGLTFALGDSAAGYAALSLMPATSEVLTTEMKINLLAPAAGSQLIATGRVIKPGRRLVIVQADVHAVEDDTKNHVAILQGTMIPV